MTGGGARAGSRKELPALLYSHNGLYSIYIYNCPSAVHIGQQPARPGGPMVAPSVRNVGPVEDK